MHVQPADAAERLTELEWTYDLTCESIKCCHVNYSALQWHIVSPCHGSDIKSLPAAGSGNILCSTKCKLKLLFLDMNCDGALCLGLDGTPSNIAAQLDIHFTADVMNQQSFRNVQVLQITNTITCRHGNINDKDGPYHVPSLQALNRPRSLS